MSLLNQNRLTGLHSLRGLPDLDSNIMYFMLRWFGGWEIGQEPENSHKQKFIRTSFPEATEQVRKGLIREKLACLYGDIRTSFGWLTLCYFANSV